MADAAWKDAYNKGGEIFVFGSNLAGRHGAGAAETARKVYGAMYGVWHGVTGQSYAIPTKDRGLETLPLPVIDVYVRQFLAYARLHPEKAFFVTKVGCGLAGIPEEDMKALFQNAPPNCELPEGW